jgi:hypothetical protein
MVIHGATALLWGILPKNHGDVSYREEENVWIGEK